MTLNTILFTACSWARLREASRDKVGARLFKSLRLPHSLHVAQFSRRHPESRP